VQAVTSWLGNSPTLAVRHYLMSTNDHFKAAKKWDHRGGAESCAKHTRDDARSRKSTGPRAKNPGSSGVCGSFRWCANDQSGG